MTFIVAEIGINWDGNLELAREMIEKSKKCGCDAVKFQAFTRHCKRSSRKGPFNEIINFRRKY